MRLTMATFAVSGLLTAFAAGQGVQYTYLWHMEQPIYWPAPISPTFDRYERAWESIVRAGGNGQGNPENNLNEIFGLDDRVAAYQYRTRDAINDIRWHPNAGAQLSYSGNLIENLHSLGDNFAFFGKYTPNWNAPMVEARNWSTSGGHPRMDILLFPFHHSLVPLCDEATVRKEIQLYKEIYPDAWGVSPQRPISRGFFPSEMAFSQRLIKVLREEGVDWVIVSNEHISRAIQNFPMVLGSGGINCDPPNRADQLNPPQPNWQRITISRGCSPVNAYPYSYQPRYARYVDPATGQEHKIIVVPADQALGWQDGYSPLGLSDIHQLNQNNNTGRPVLLMLAHDGDNAWGGGFSYYREAVPNFASSATAAGYQPTTVEQYLSQYPPDPNDIVHVEDGAWVNADGDFGAPQFINWLWPLITAQGAIDIENGWHVDARNWAVITAMQNRVEHAEKLAGPTRPRHILYPTLSGTTAAERAWHYFLGAFNSGFMYYGTPLDHEVKIALACNEAARLADPVIAGGSSDTTAPSIFIPQRHPWNPGSLNYGPQYGYRQFNSNGDFWIWTFAYDVSGLARIELKYRLDDDGQMSDANRTYAGGTGVGGWITVPMTQRDFPAGNVYNDPEINFFIMPQYIARQYWTKITTVREKLVDYYIEAEDVHGNIKRTPIQHVWVGDGSGSGGSGGPAVELIPSQPVAGQSVIVRYDASGRNLAGQSPVQAHVGYDGWSTVIGSQSMTSIGPNLWEITLLLPPGITELDLAFNVGGTVWDNNGGADWRFPVSGGCPAAAAWVMDGQLDANVPAVATNGTASLYAQQRGDLLYVAAPAASAGQDRFIFIALSSQNPPVNAPWAKAGQVLSWSCLLANEEGNGWSGWFDTQGAAAAQQARGAILEGVVNLAGQNGGIRPREVWVASVTYGTADGGTLSTATQLPPAVTVDGNVQATELVRIPIFARGDVDSNARVDALDLAALLSALGCTTCDCRPLDLNNDSTIDTADAALLLAELGS